MGSKALCGRRSSGARRRSATSWPTSRSWACSPTRTPRPAGSRPRPATATSSTGCSPRRTRARPLALSLVRRELDEAMRVTTETLSQVTNLLAIVTAPPIETSTIRHVEVLVLQPQVLMVVVITSTGGVTKRLFTFAAPGRHRAGRLGRQLPQRAARRARARARGCCTSGSTTRRCSATEAAFLDALAPVFTELEEAPQDDAVRRGHRRGCCGSSGSATCPSSTR